jgi:phosphoribosylanthranilate isomerase
MTPQVKICGLMRRADVATAVEAGADYGGVILATGRARSVRAARAGDIFDGFDLRRVGVFVDESISDLLAAAEIARLDVVQLHGDENAGYVEEVRRAGTWRVWKALRLSGSADFPADIAGWEGIADGILLDGWSPLAEGGTGTAFDWAAAAVHRDRIPAGLDLIVAGGLRPDNVRAAVDLLHPAVIDVSSGVESAVGVKSSDLVHQFIRRVHAL